MRKVRFVAAALLMASPALAQAPTPAAATPPAAAPATAGPFPTPTNTTDGVIAVNFTGSERG